MAEHDELALSIGPFLLRTLDPRTRERVRAHLETCEVCRRELVQLAGMPGFLVLAGGPDPDPDAIPPARLRERLAAAAVAEREQERQHAEAERAALARERDHARGRSRVVAAAVALLLVALPATALVAARLARPPAPPEPPLVAMTTVTSTMPISGRASINEHTWGSELVVVAEGPPAPQRFVLLAESRDGRREQAATWTGGEDGEVRCSGTASILVADLARVVVASESGEELLVLET